MNNLIIPTLDLVHGVRLIIGRDPQARHGPPNGQSVGFLVAV